MREQDENSEQMLRKTNHEIKKSDKKTEKDDRENEEHDRRKYLNKNDDQTVDDCDLSAFFAQNQRFIETKIKQKNEINDMNQRKIKDKTNAEDERSENDRSDA